MAFEVTKDTIIGDMNLIHRAEQGEVTSLTTLINGEKYLAYYFPLHDQRGKFVKAETEKNLKESSSTVTTIPMNGLPRPKEEGF